MSNWIREFYKINLCSSWIPLITHKPNCHPCYKSNFERNETKYQGGEDAQTDERTNGILLTPTHSQASHSPLLHIATVQRPTFPGIATSPLLNCAAAFPPSVRDGGGSDGGLLGVHRRHRVRGVAVVRRGKRGRSAVEGEGKVDVLYSVPWLVKLVRWYNARGDDLCRQDQVGTSGPIPSVDALQSHPHELPPCPCPNSSSSLRRNGASCYRTLRVVVAVVVVAVATDLWSCAWAWPGCSVVLETGGATRAMLGRGIY